MFIHIYALTKNNNFVFFLLFPLHHLSPKGLSLFRRPFIIIFQQEKETFLPYFPSLIRALLQSRSKQEGPKSYMAVRHN